MADNNIVGAALTMSLDGAKILVMQGMKGEDGKSLRVNSSGHVEYWDDATQQWVDTGIEAEGVPGPPGEDGFSPEVVISGISGGHRVTITDEDGQHSFNVLDGSNGSNGDDGYSPTVTVVAISGGNRITITDANGNHSFDVMDGTGIPDLSEAETGDVLTVGLNGEVIAAAPLKQVQRVNYYAAASGTHAQGDLTVVSGGAEIPTSGLALANAIADGYYPVVFEVGTSYPRVYHPEMILAGTMITFRSTDVNGNVAVLNVEWNASTATPFFAIGDMPMPDAQTDVGKVPTVNSSGSYTLQTPSGEAYTLHLTGDATNGYQITESAAEIMAHYPNIVLTYEDSFTDEYYLVGARLEEEAMWGYLWFAHDENWITDGTVSRDFVDLSLVWDTESAIYGVTAYRSSTALRNLPQASSAQNGKLLGVVGGDYAFVNDRLPAVTSADNGKVLKVVNGVWAAVSE